MARSEKRYMANNHEDNGNSKTDYYVGIYSRLSVDHHDKKSESVENQIEIVKQYIERNNHNINSDMNLIIYDIYIDRGVSGTTFKRASLERLMEDIRDKKVNCIIVKDLSRLGRDYLEAGELLEKTLPSLKCRFIAVADNYDSISAYSTDDNLTMNIKNMVNDMYAKDISKRVSAVKKMAAEEGNYLGSIPPYGYEIIGKLPERRLEINEECEKIVQKIYDLYNQGMSYRGITEILYKDRVHRISDYNKYSHVYCEEGESLHQWSESSVSRIIRNQRLLQNRSEICVDKENITLTDGKKKKIEYKRTENIYRNVLYCGHCGKIMHTTYYQSKTKEERHYAYYCKGAYLIDDRKCEKIYIREECINKAVLEQLYTFLKERHIKEERLIEENKRECHKRIKSYELEVRQIRRETEYLMKKSAILYGQYKDALISKESYIESRLHKRQQEVYAKKRLAQLEEKIINEKERAEEENEYIRALFREDKCKKLSIQLVENLIERIEINAPSTVHIVYKM